MIPLWKLMIRTIEHPFPFKPWTSNPYGTHQPLLPFAPRNSDYPCALAYGGGKPGSSRVQEQDLLWTSKITGITPPVMTPVILTGRLLPARGITP